MTWLVDAASWVLLVGGGLFCLIGGFGLLRLPDFHSRIHAAGVTDTLGAGLILVGLMLQGGLSQVSVKLLMVLALLLVTSPTASHALVKAAFARGLRFEGEKASSDGTG